MANELKHITTDRAAAGAVTQAEFDKITAHGFDSQATGDMPYASSAAQLSRLAIGGAEGRLLVVSSANLPEWVKGLIARGRWFREGWEMPLDMWAGSTEVLTGTGATALDTGGVRLRATLGATHASTAGRIKRVNIEQEGGDSNGMIDFSKPSWLYAVLHGDGAASFPSTTMRLYCEDSNPGTLAALAAHGYGISVLAGAISLATRGSGGSEQLVASSPAKTLGGGGWWRQIFIEHSPGAYVKMWVNGTLVASQTTAANIPSAVGALTAVKYAILRSGGADTTDNAFRIGELIMGGTF